MTHLKIEQDTGTRETVASSVIKKLYDLAKEIELDVNGTIALKGWLYTSATYEDYITYLLNISKVNNEPLLTIDAGKAYIMFADPAVLSVLATTYGDGTGVTLNELTSISEILLLFKNNTDITKFNEFKYFTSITTPAAEWLSDWFSGCTNLTEITVPKNVRSITKAAFLGCTSLHTVTFDTGSVAESISGFKNCSSLTNIQLPNTVLTLGQDCFSGCTSLTSLNTNNITSIDRGAFGGSGITTIDLSNVTNFGNYAFLGCRQLSSIGSLSTNVTTIGIEGFSNCSSLVINNLSLPHLTTLGESVFVNVGIKQVSNLGLITSIPYSTFYGCTQLTSVTLPLTVTSIGARAFLNCSTLPSIDLSNITSIANDAFNGCSSLSSIGTLNNSMTSIPDNCFRDCTSLTIFDFSNITNLGLDAFRGCTSLGTGQTLELNLTNLARHFGGALYSTKFSRVILHRSNTVMDGDKNNPPLRWLPNATYIDVSDFPLPMADGNTISSLYGDNSLVTCIYPSNITYLSAEEFNTNTGGLKYMIILNTTPPNLNDTDRNNPLSSYFRTNNILHIYVPDSAKADYLADSKWSLLTGLNGSVTIADRLHGLSELPAGVWTTGLAASKYHFFNDPEVTRVLTLAYAVEDGVALTNSDIAAITSIPAETFKNNTSITSFNELGLLSLITNIGAKAFLWCSNLIDIDLHNITSIGHWAFDGSGITEANLSSILTLGVAVFCGCSNLESVTIGSGISFIDTLDFLGCTSLTSIDLSNITSIGANAFNGCTLLPSVDLSNCTTIGENAFKGCTALTTVTGSNLTNLKDGAFQGCTSLTSIDFSNVVENIGAFMDCSSLGLNQDLDMNLDGKSFGANAFRNTGYRTITLHETTEHKITNFAGSGQYDAFGARMANLTKLDLSDTKQTGSTGALYANAMTTLIYPETQTSLALLGRDYGDHLLYIVCLSRNIGDISDNPGGWTWYGTPSSCAIYVQDDIFDTYMLMTGWAAQEGAGRVKKISQLPSDITWYTKSNP